MEKTQHNFAVLFADVAGSTHIYETVGDVRASKIIGDVLTLMTDIVRSHSGTLVKTIGDEVMCRFSRLDDAVEAACEINEKLSNDPPSRELPLAVRTGVHWGPALLQEDGDLLGDVVNVAARMTSIARGGQIITTEDVVSGLSVLLKYKCREFDRTEVKGKSQSIVIYEIVWEPQDVTRLAPLSDFSPQVSGDITLEISYQGFLKNISSDTGALVMGRGDQCDLVVKSPLASRSHAVIKFTRGKYLLVDQSTNGTYVRFNDGKTFYLRRESLPLSDSGEISLGEQFAENSAQYIRFKL